jgi:hypothetical protein
MKIKAKTKEHDKYVVGYYLPEAVMTGENFTGFIDTYGVGVGPIVVEGLVAYEIDPETVQESADVLDKNGDPLFIRDIISITPEHSARIVARSNYIVYREDRDTQVRPSLIISNLDGGAVVELVSRPDGSWLKMNSIGTFNIELIKDIETPGE